MTSTPYTRFASHAGSWYSGDAKTLNEELTHHIDAVKPSEAANPSGKLTDQALSVEPYPIAGCKAVIAPHAGYSYSGPTAAWAYKSIDTAAIKRVFILGPSHHYYLNGCALSSFKEYATPLGNLPLDRDTIDELYATGKFEFMTPDDDEAEHSIEMHLPYVRKIFEGKDITIVPILVGSISKRSEATFGELLGPYLTREDTFCVISSDFCHWGLRFSYTYYYPEPAPSEAPAVQLSRQVNPSPSFPIHSSISRLDREAMDILTVPPSTAAMAHDQFSQYQTRTKNTICGRHPIGVLFGALAHLEKTHQNFRPTVKWVRYEQSSACENIADSSVSYASAWVRF